jgi:hypothetical protein
MYFSILGKIYSRDPGLAENLGFPVPLRARGEERLFWP